MGIISNLNLELDTYPPNRIMKLCLLAIALVAGVIAEPESKPWLTGYGLGYGYGGYGLGYAGYGLGYGYGHHLIGKRSADAEPESKPWLAGYGLGYGGYGLGYGGYAGYGGYGLGYGRLGYVW